VYNISLLIYSLLVLLPKLISYLMLLQEHVRDGLRVQLAMLYSLLWLNFFKIFNFF